MSNSDKKIKLVLMVLALPLTVILWGWVNSVLWAWFPARIFELPLISIPEAIGLNMAISMITGVSTLSILLHDLKGQIGGSTEEGIITYITYLTMPFIVLFVAYIVKAFV